MREREREGERELMDDCGCSIECHPDDIALHQVRGASAESLNGSLEERETFTLR